jgi:hypothetical protein
MIVEDWLETKSSPTAVFNTLRVIFNTLGVFPNKRFLFSNNSLLSNKILQKIGQENHHPIMKTQPEVDIRNVYGVI